MIREVTMYRIVCDADGCEASPSDESEYYAWSERQDTIDHAEDRGDWWMNADKTRHLCLTHSPSFCDDCDEQHEGSCA